MVLRFEGKAGSPLREVFVPIDESCYSGVYNTYLVCGILLYSNLRYYLSYRLGSLPVPFKKSATSCVSLTPSAIKL